jgi:flagellar hook protein FlgE
MSTIPAFQSAISGIQSGLHRMNKNAADIANANVAQNDTDITQAIVNIISDEQQIKASAKVIEAHKTMLGSLLDIKV